MKFTQTSYGNKKEILKFADHFVSIGVKVDATGIVADADGRKIIPAGTIVGSTTGGKPVLQNLSTVKVKAATFEDTGSTTNAEGVLLNDVDVTHGDANGSMIIHGYINVNKLPAADQTLVSKAYVLKAMPQISFIK